MKTEIIKSESRLKRYKSLSFTLSFFITGLGQVYNGDLSRAVIFIALRIFSLLIIPLFALTKSSSYSVLFLILPAAFSLLVWLISPLEAIYSSNGKDAFNLKKYNSIIFYIFYAFIASALIIASALFVLSFFSMGKVAGDDMNPGLKKSEIILINKYAAKDISVGDVILFSSEKIITAGRVVAKEGNTVGMKNNVFYINDTALIYGIILKTDLEKMAIDNSEDLFYEINRERKYPVRLEKKNGKIPPGQPVFLESGKYFIAFDNRSINTMHYIIGSADVAGRIEGIIFSRQLKRIFNKMYFEAEQFAE